MFSGLAYKSVVIIAEYGHPSIPKKMLLKKYEKYSNQMLYSIMTVCCNVKLKYVSHVVKTVWKTKGQPDNSSMMPF